MGLFDFLKKQQLSCDTFKFIYRAADSEYPDVYRFLMEGPGDEGVSFGCNDPDELRLQLDRTLKASSKTYNADSALMTKLMDGLRESYLLGSFDIDFNKAHKKPWRFKSNHRGSDRIYLCSTVLFCDDTVDGLLRKLRDARLLIASRN